MNINIKPILTEKSIQAAQRGDYTFVVPKNLNKHKIAQLISEAFGVEVVNVHTMRYKSLEKQNMYRKTIKLKGKKKAIVKLKKDQKIDLFSGDSK